MVYNIIENRLGVQPIASIETTARHALGTIVRAEDPTYGMGEFIYLNGVASTVVGNLVIYNPVLGTTTLSPNTSVQARPVAVAMAACTLSYYGWYQIDGAAIIKKEAVIFAPTVVVYQSTTTGRIRALAASGKQVLGARSANTASVVSATSTVVVLINRPHMQGAVT